MLKKIRQGFADFCNGLSIIFSKPNAGEGDRKLAKVSLMLEAQINSHTKHELRRGVIRDIERVLRSEARKGGNSAVDEKLAISLATPEWVRMINRLGLDESHVQVMAMEAKKHAK